MEQAANVVANQKQHQLQLDRAMGELEKLNASTRQALMMAEQAKRRGRPGEGPRLQPGR